MIDGQHHVKLNGVLYKLIEREGKYVKRLEPLRPPNSVVVQGQDRQDLFQVRPDVLLWSLTDWSGGEGQYKYSFTSSNKAFRIANMDPFSRPGTITPGPAFDTTLYANGNPFNAGVILAPFGEKLWGWSMFLSGVFFEWNNSTKRWPNAGTVVTGSTPVNPPSPDGVVSDDLRAYYLDGTNGNVYKVDNAGAGTQMNSGASVITDPGNASLRELGDYIYAFLPSQGKVWEMPKSASGASTWTVLHAPFWGGTANFAVNNRFQVATGQNRLWYMEASEGGETRVFEVTPTSAAGAGSTAQVANIRGAVGTGIWYSGGMLWLTAWEGEATQEGRVLFYINPTDYSYGVVDRILPNYVNTTRRRGRAWGSEAGVKLGANLFTVYDDFNIAGETRIYQHDPVSGGLAQLSAIDRDQTDEAMTCVTWQGDIFQQFFKSGSAVLYRAPAGTFIDSDDTDEGIFVISPWHDFGLAEEKILSSVSVTTEELPADWTVTFSYAIDGDDTFTSMGTISTTGSTGSKFSVSTSSSTVLFRSLQLKAQFTYTGSADPITAAPVLTQIDVKAQVSQPQNTWTLMLDVSDDLAAITQRHLGSKKITNIETAGDNAVVVEFVDGYKDRENSGRTTHSVLIDSYQLVLDRPGEGYVQVTLRETA